MEAHVYRVWVTDGNPEDATTWRPILEVHVPAHGVAVNAANGKLNVVAGVNGAVRYGARDTLPRRVIRPPHSAVRLATHTLPLAPLVNVACMEALLAAHTTSFELF